MVNDDGGVVFPSISLSLGETPPPCCVTAVGEYSLLQDELGLSIAIACFIISITMLPSLRST